MDAEPHTHKHSESLRFERLTFFSDAVFAIAITLLVLDLKLPPTRDGVLHFEGMTPKFVGFGVSFFVIGIYWLAHHRLFGTLRREDGKLRLINLMFLASIVFLPFPTSVIAEYPATTVSVVLYALSVSAVGVLLIALACVARRPKLMRLGETRGGTWHFVIRSLAAPSIFLSSAAVAYAKPSAAAFLWLLIYPAILISERIARWVQHRVDGAG